MLATRFSCGLSCLGLYEHATDQRSSHVPAFQKLQECEVSFPIIADASGEIFYLLGLVREDAIDPAQGLVPQVGCSAALVLHKLVTSLLLRVSEQLFQMILLLLLLLCIVYMFRQTK